MNIVRLEIFMAVAVKMSVLWDLMLQTDMSVVMSLTLQTETAGSSEILVQTSVT